MDILAAAVQKGLLPKDQTEDVKKEAERLGYTVEQVLLRKGISPQNILELQGEYFDVPTRAVNVDDVSDKILEYVPQESAEHYNFVPIGLSDGVLEIGMTQPDDIEARDALNFISSKVGMPFKIFLITENDFAKVISLYKGLTGEVSKALSELETELKVEPPSKREENDKPESEKAEGGGATSEISEDAPVTKIVATILRYATDGNASDIHIEPWRENVKVRFRVDGIMNTSLVLPFKVHSAVVSRIKILSNMRLDEKRKPQDGRFTARIEGRKIDFRVSTFPTYFGEKVVMRLLDQEKGVKKLADLGFSEKNLEIIKKAINRPYGLILMSGPTGSGKTSTLYSMLNEIDRDHQNVLSLEDPIEYNIEGMSQSQVKPEIGYDFANGLRTTLRQDPDVIMVGEIRDKETAQLAVQAALTGHLVLSTIHTNSAVGVIPRLIDMGVDQYLIAPTLILAIAQRLVRALCPDSGKPVPISESIQLMIDNQFKDLPKRYVGELDFTDKIYEILPGPDCPNGTRGRMAVLEVLEMDKSMEEIILKNPTEIEIMKVAREKGMLTMKEDAILKAMHRQIPFEEVGTL
jgi:type IV pilus assembly protein PilB